MAAPLFVKDNKILWLQVPKVGSPPVWLAGTNYKLGDSVVPTAPPPALADFMFLCVGFLGLSGLSQPTFPGSIGATVVDNDILWKCEDPVISPAQLDKSEYVLIDQVVVVNT